jgi:hypothetical protein
LELFIGQAGNERQLLLFICNTVYFIVKLGKTWVRVMMFNAIFNNISVISWLSVLLVTEFGEPKENYRSTASR